MDDRPCHRIRTTALVQEAAQRLRQEATIAERALWERLRNRQLAGIKFRRQHPFGQFVADFYCAEGHLVIELDGEIHHIMQERDQARSAELGRLGCQVLRFTNQRVRDDMEGVLAEIMAACGVSNP
jgi:very-short-patch-repair endonuclease